MRFILGESGTGKTTKCMNEIKDLIENGYDGKIIYIVPEQFSFESERKLIEVIGRPGIIGAQVLSFKRLAYRVFSENNIVVNNLSDAGKNMIIYFIMLKLEKDLLVLNGVGKNVGLVNTVADEISEFKRYGVNPEILSTIDFKNEYLNMKMHDLSLIYSEYEKKIEGNQIDSNDELKVLLNVLKANPQAICNAKIWIDEFDGFIPQELDIIKELNKKNDITISMISGQGDLFELNNLNLEKLKGANKNLVNSSNYENFEDEVITLNQNKRFNNKELLHLEENIYRFPYKVYSNKVNNIFLNEYQNSYEEVEAVAKRIRRIMINGLGDNIDSDIRYENIAVLTRDIDKYKNLFKMIFPLYDIPYFFDDKKELSLEPLMSLIIAVLEIISNNYQYESMFGYLKTGLTNIDDENDIDLIENYILKYGIKGKKWEEDFTIEDENLERINLIRNQIISPLLKLKSSFNGRKSTKEIIANLFEFLKEIDVYNTIQKKVDSFYDTGDEISIRQAQEYTQVWNLLISIFDEMALSIGDEQISFDRFKSIFKLGISNREISVIPSTKDKVIIGDVERTRNSEIKVLFVVGVNDGSFPKAFQTEGFINDNDRKLLLENGIEVAKDTKNALKLELFNIYKALAVPSDYLYISYPISDLEGKSIRPAYLIHQIKSIFPQIIPNSINTSTCVDKATLSELFYYIRSLKDGAEENEYWNMIQKWYEENRKEKYSKIIKGLDYKNTIEYQEKEISRRLYGKAMNTSVSKLETFSTCPFMFYLRYGLRLKDREIYKLAVPDIGSFLHEIIELFSKKVLEENIDLRKISKDECDSIVEEISSNVIKEFRHNLFSSTGKLRKLSYKLIEQSKKTVWLIVHHINSGSFNLLGSEIEFGKDKDFPEINIELSSGEKLVLSGKVDRVDIAKLDDGNYIRIVDYKSSNKVIKLSNIYYGIQLQLLAYADAISQDNLKPGGVLYLKLDDPIAKVDKRISKEEVEEQIVKALRMNGLVISNAKLIEAMDNEFNSEKISYESNIINLKKNKDGKLSKMPVVSEEEFSMLRKHMRKTLKEIGEEIISGNIENKPLYKNNATKPCDYCEFTKICRFDRELGNKARRVNELKDDEVIEKIKSSSVEVISK